MKLFKPLKLNNQELKNRIVVAPMCQYSSTDGFATDWHLMHYGQFAAGQTGLIIQEATAVSPEGRITFADLGIWNDKHITSLKKIVNFIHQNNGLIGIQLAHAGRKSSTNIPWINRKQFTPSDEKGWQTLAPTTKAYHPSDIPPLEMSENDIKKVVKDFINATQRSIKCGYDVIEIHAAHGYLFHQFMSPLINTRTDAYGGNFENRIRLLLEVTKAVKKQLSTQSLWVRISATDWAKNGWDLKQSILLAQKLEQLGVEVIDVSTGGAVKEQQIPVEDGYQVLFAEKIKEHTNLIVGTVGLIRTGKHANRIINKNQADLILAGRGFLQNPHLPYAWAKELNHTINWQPQYERGKENF